MVVCVRCFLNYVDTSSTFVKQIRKCHVIILQLICNTIVTGNTKLYDTHGVPNYPEECNGECIYGVSNTNVATLGIYGFWWQSTYSPSDVNTTFVSFNLPWASSPQRGQPWKYKILITALHPFTKCRKTFLDLPTALIRPIQSLESTSIALLREFHLPTKRSFFIDLVKK